MSVLEAWVWVALLIAVIGGLSVLGAVKSKEKPEKPK